MICELQKTLIRTSLVLDITSGDESRHGVYHGRNGVLTVQRLTSDGIEITSSFHMRMTRDRSLYVSATQAMDTYPMAGKLRTNP